MSKNQKFLENLEALGGTKLNVKASEDRDQANEEIINKNIADIEKQINSSIPDDFLSFIKESGAITFKKPVYVKAVDKIPVANNKNQVGIDNFMDFFEDDASILKQLDSMKGNIPDHVLPICEGEPGDIIVIDMLRDSHGKIYYWYHEHSDDTDGLYLVAENFNQFVARLFNITDEEESSSSVTVTKVSDKFLERLKKSGKV